MVCLPGVRVREAAGVRCICEALSVPWESSELAGGLAGRMPRCYERRR